jgi:hypothetical protein
MSGAPLIVKVRTYGLDGGMADGTTDKDEKATRLAAQLRANLKRRKEQARAIAATPGTKDDDVSSKSD